MLVLDDDDLCAAVRSVAPNPLRFGRYVLYDVLRRNVQALAVVESLRSPLRFAYDVRANSDRALLEMVNDAGLYLAVDTLEELRLALEIGFANRTIFSGPQPEWGEQTPGIVFSDSPAVFFENARTLEGTLVGLHVQLEQLSDACDAVRASGRRTIGVAMRAQPATFASRSWRGMVASTIEFARHIETHTRARVTAFDVGGGRTPLEFDRSLACGDFAWLLRETLAALPHAHAVFSEPGTAVAIPGALVVAPVTEVRRVEGQTEVVVDAGPAHFADFAHRVVGIVGGTCALLGTGSDRILAASGDVIRDDVLLPSDLDRLAAIVVGDMGTQVTLNSIVDKRRERGVLSS